MSRSKERRDENEKSITELTMERVRAERIEPYRAALAAIVSDAWLCADGNYLVDAKFIEAAEEIV